MKEDPFTFLGGLGLLGGDGGGGGVLGRAADELDAGEDVDPAGQEHGEALDPHAALLARAGRGLVPAVKVPAPRLVVAVVEEAVLRDEEGVRLELAGCDIRVIGKQSQDRVGKK